MEFVGIYFHICNIFHKIDTQLLIFLVQHHCYLCIIC